MKGFRILVDFLNFTFFLMLVIVVILYIVVGDRIEIITKIVKMIIPVAYFVGMFLLAVRSDQDKFEKFRKEDKLDEIIKYLDRVDSFKDILVIITMPVLILLIGMIEELSVIDVIQALSAFIFMYIWHIILFRKREDLAGMQCVTNFDKIKDTIVVFILPLVVIAIPLSTGLATAVDIFQAFAAFLLMYVWRKIMFLKEK